MNHAQSTDPTLSVGLVADFLADVNDDVLPDRYFEIDWHTATHAEYVDLFKRVYLHGSCAEFAYALHHKYAWPIVRFMDASYKLHYACRLPDGAFFDASGRTTLEAIKKRYRFGKRVVPLDVEPDECLRDSDDDGPWAATTLATFVIDYLKL
jgi:hypothetical protein